MLQDYILTYWTKQRRHRHRRRRHRRRRHRRHRRYHYRKHIHILDTVEVMQRGLTKFLCLRGDDYNVKFSLNYSNITYVDSMKTLIFKLADFEYVLSQFYSIRPRSTKLQDIYELCTH